MKGRRLLFLGLLALGLASGAVGYIVGFAPPQVGNEYVDYSSISFAHPELTLSQSPADPMMLDVSVQAKDGLDMVACSTAALQTLGVVEEGLVKFEKKPEKIRVTIYFDQAKRAFLFGYGQYSRLAKGEIGPRAFWTKALADSPAAEEATSSKGRFNAFQGAFGALCGAQVRQDGNTLKLEIKAEKKWQRQVSQAMLAVYIAASSSKLSIDYVNVLVVGLSQKTLWITFAYKHLLDLVEGREPQAEFPTHLFMEWR